MREKHDEVTTPSTTTPEDPTPERSGVPVDIEIPVHPVNESFESIDEPEVTEDPHGFRCPACGHVWPILKAHAPAP